MLKGAKGCFGKGRYLRIFPGKTNLFPGTKNIYRSLNINMITITTITITITITINININIKILFDPGKAAVI